MFGSLTMYLLSSNIKKRAIRQVSKVLSAHPDQAFWGYPAAFVIPVLPLSDPNCFAVIIIQKNNNNHNNDNNDDNNDNGNDSENENNNTNNTNNNNNSSNTNNNNSNNHNNRLFSRDLVFIVIYSVVVF